VKPSSSVVPIVTFAPSDILDGAIPRVGVDLATLIVTRLLITGDSRSGKSRMVRQLLEQTYGHVPHLVIDPEGDFATLRERFDYLLVGRGGELAADVATAAQLARSLFQLHANAILDLSDLKKPVQREYVAAFVGALMDIHQHEGHPTIVVCDEAQFFAPEGGRGESHDPLMEIAHRGGKRGFCLVAVTPTLSELSKEVARGLQNRLIFRTTLDIDIDRSAKRLGFRTAAQKDQLPHLARGESFAFGPAFLEHGVRKVRGVDETLTTHIDITKGARPAPPPRRESLNELVEQLRDFQAAAKVEENELEQLRARVKELERYLEGAEAGSISVEQHQQDVTEACTAAAAEATRLERERQDRLRHVLQRELVGALEAVGEVPALLAGLDATVTRVRDRLASADQLLGDGWFPAATEPATSPPAPDPAEPPASSIDTVLHRAELNGSGELSIQERKILDAIAEANAMGIAQPERAMVAALAGVSPTSSTTGTKISQLQKSGFLVFPKANCVALSSKGVKVSRAPATAKNLRQLHEAWLRLFSESERDLLGALINRYPRAIERTTLAEAVDRSPTSSTFGTQLSYMQKLGAIEYPEKGLVKASALLFPEGLR
jgi:hypothetical protein